MSYQICIELDEILCKYHMLRGQAPKFLMITQSQLIRLCDMQNYHNKKIKNTTIRTDLELKDITHFHGIPLILKDEIATGYFKMDEYITEMPKYSGVFEP